MKPTEKFINKLSRQLILDELFDLSLYRTLHRFSRNELQQLLEDLIVIELKHFEFWQKFFKMKIDELNLGRKFKLWLIAGLCRIFGEKGIHLVLEAIEIYGIKKYLSIWELYKDQHLGNAVREILLDELQHEDQIVSSIVERKINAERIRNIFLGFNDGLVEILGAVSGFFAAFNKVGMVLAASFTVAVAGALSMAAGAFVASGSEEEVRKVERSKNYFLGKSADEKLMGEKPLSSAILVGISYLIGAMIPVLPVLFGTKNVLFSIIFGGSMIILVSLILAFLSGMNIRKRTVTNLVIIAVAVGITYSIGVLIKRIWGISL
jgi:predicted membrane protein (TIGR00267 family)